MSILDQKIDALFNQIAAFELTGRAGSLEGFPAAMDYVVGQFEVALPQADLGASADEALCQRVRETDPSSSLLRLVTVNTIGMFLSVRGQGLPKFQALYFDMVRLRPSEMSHDAEYIEHVLVPRLLRLSDLGGNADIACYLLLRLAGYLEAMRAPRTLSGSVTRVGLQREPLPTLLLGFARRYLAHGGKRLVDTEGMLEYGLKRERFFQWMRDEGRRQECDTEPFLNWLLLLPPLTPWQRFRKSLHRFFGAIGALLGGIGGRIPSGGLMWSGFWIAFALLLAIGVPVFWFVFYEHRLDTFDTNAHHVRVKAIEVVSRPAEDHR